MDTKNFAMQNMPNCIKSFEPDYVVPTHVDNIHSFFKGRKPQRKEE
jgi:hypothetical protein